jgi:NTP pyrophosphatase (non-canonical NTP hydrolase)
MGAGQYPGFEEQFGKVLVDVRVERMRQNVKWGIQDWPPESWIAILGEEYGEVCRAVCEMTLVPPEKRDPKWLKNYREELIHVAAVAIEAVEAFDRAQRS